MMLNSLTDGDAAGYHSFVIREIEHQKVSFVTKNGCNGQSSFLTDTAISQMKICQSLIMLNTLG